MSRIGKKPIIIPEGVTVTVAKYLVSVKGPKGELARMLHPAIKAEVHSALADKGGVQGSLLTVSPVKDTAKKSSALWGLTRTLIANMVEGVTKGFQKKLEFEGIGYRASVEGDGTLLMQVGFSHPVRIKPKKDISFLVEKNVITVSGIDKESVGETAARVRDIKPPEPYKGKGIRYRGEVIRRKAGKKAVASA